MEQMDCVGASCAVLWLDTAGPVLIVHHWILAVYCVGRK